MDAQKREAQSDHAPTPSRKYPEVPSWIAQQASNVGEKALETSGGLESRGRKTQEANSEFYLIVGISHTSPST